MMSSAAGLEEIIRKLRSYVTIWQERMGIGLCRLPLLTIDLNWSVSNRESELVESRIYGGLNWGLIEFSSEPQKE